MTPHEKAVNAINARLERLQANLRDAKVESAQQFLFQSLVAIIGVAEALSDYIKRVGGYAQRRHEVVKQASESLGAQHAELLDSGKELLKQLQASPSDRTILREIESVQRKMEAVQKAVRRGANTLQRELAPSLSLIDELSVSIRRFSEAGDGAALKRVLSTLVTQVRDFYADQGALPATDLAEIAAWETSALAEIDRSADFYDAFARAGYQTALALELVSIALDADPPQTAAEATRRATDAVAARIQGVTARFNGEPG